MGDYLEARRRGTEERTKELLAKLAATEVIAAGRACVYATGSFGRLESSSHSDLDLFIVGQQRDGARQLSNLDEICLKADLIEATRALSIPDFSGDGEYLEHYTVETLVKNLGMPRDDQDNTFTARLLLLLESIPLLGKDVYETAIDDVIAAYWRDYTKHPTDFVPAYLANDVLRLWRTFCVNYEARTGTDPEEKRAKRKLKNYKLKHSRLLTCYSGLAYLLAVFAKQKTVTPKDARAMAGLTPTQRLQTLVTDFDVKADTVAPLLDAYEQFLRTTDADEQALVATFMDPTRADDLLGQANAFSETVYELLQEVGPGTRLHRMLTV